jgi:hypothetical protein
MSHFGVKREHAKGLKLETQPESVQANGTTFETVRALSHLWI